MSQAYTGRLSEKEQQSCASIYERYFRLVCSQAYWRLHDYEAARDLAHEVLGITLPQVICGGLFPAVTSQQIAFLKILVRNLASKQQRRNKVCLVTTDNSTDPDQCLEFLANRQVEPTQETFADSLMDVQKILDRLPKKEREVLVLTEFGGLSRKEITSQTGLSPSSQPIYVSTARKLAKEFSARE